MAKKPEKPERPPNPWKAPRHRPNKPAIAYADGVDEDGNWKWRKNPPKKYRKNYIKQEDGTWLPKPIGEIDEG
jgi:hypothetical protein